MIKLQIIGHLGKDAELKDVNGKKVMNFSVAHTEKYKNAQGVSNEKTTWVECGMWDAANLAPFLKKGTQVYIEGAPDVRGFVVADEGVPRATLRCNVFRLQLLGGKKEAAKPGEATTPDVANAGANGDDMPF